MSSFNYMDNVPVKISEKYKPPPRIYQLPTAIVNKLQLPEGHYQESPQYTYTFQLERKVLSKIPEYRRTREVEREARRNRREKREQELQRQIEEKHKELLGAVSYPNAAELSSSEEDEAEELNAKSKSTENIAKVMLKKDMNWHNHNFNNILQPTVLSNEVVNETNKDLAFAAFEKAIANQNKTINTANTHSNNLTGCNVNSKLVNTFNYKDFEEFADNSSPFDNIEFKTINDLDILAQVLHDTQLKANNKEENCIRNGEVSNKEQQQEVVDLTEEIVASNKIATTTATTIDLEKVNFSDISLELTQPQQHNDNIPITEHYLQNSFLNATAHNFLPFQNNYQVYHNQNLLFSPNCNQFATTAADNSTSIQQTMPYLGNNNINNDIKQIKSYHNTPKSTIQLKEDELQAQASKSKSVPDIIRELRDELKNSEIRRTRLRNHSYNQSDERDDSESEQSSKEASSTTVKKSINEDECLSILEQPLQTLAKNISSMGFPLERVAKVIKIYGDDDKKIVEHLIPLTELLDLGFEESRISEALIKFDNNKEKALEHLIS